MWSSPQKAKEEFILKAKKIHGDKYDFSKSVYTHSKKKVCVTCYKHGDFYITPNSLLKGCGCRKCYEETISKRCRKTEKQFIEEMKEKFGDIYDFSQVKYVTNKDKVDVFCKKHGLFKIRPNDLVCGYGCPKCGHERTKAKLSKTTEEFISQSNIIHNFKYTYLKTSYVNEKEKVCITCPIHGDFLQIPIHHLHGHGCPKCKSSKIEREIELFLVKNHIQFEFQKQFKWLRTNKRIQLLDFYLTEYNIAIECQGIQHFKPVDFASKGHEKQCFEITRLRDKNKFKLCE